MTPLSGGCILSNMKGDNKDTVEMRIREVPKDLHKQFAHICLDEDKTISEKAIEIFQEYVNRKTKVTR